jgi:hypothetical protein
MKCVKYLPEVERNRVLTNWVRASYAPRHEDSDRRLTIFGRPRSFKVRIFWLFVLISACLIYFGVPAVNSTRADVVGQTDIRGVSSNDAGGVAMTSKCSTDDLRSNLESYVPTRDANEPILGYKALASQYLGGALVVDFACEDPKRDEVFRSMWLLIKEKWLIEKISRPPSRQSGDF